MRRVAATSRAAGSALLVALASLVMLSGCVPDDSPPAPPQTTATAAPVFASEEEALAAATEAYKNYLAVSDLIAQEGGQDASRFSAVVTPEWLEREQASAELFRERAVKQIGSSTFDRVSVQQWTQDADATEVTLYLCFDLRSVQIVNLDGSASDIPRVDRPVPIEVLVTAPADDVLRVGRISPWTGDDFCAG